MGNKQFVKIISVCLTGLLSVNYPIQSYKKSCFYRFRPKLFPTMKLLISCCLLLSSFLSQQASWRVVAEIRNHAHSINGHITIEVYSYPYFGFSIKFRTTLNHQESNFPAYAQNDSAQSFPKSVLLQRIQN